MFRLDGKVAIVTGASSGLGVVFARALAEAGADVALGARRVDQLEQTQRLVEKIGRRAIAVRTDVTNPEVEGAYQLQDYLQLKALPRAFVLRVGPDGITDLRAYGAHERPLTDHRTGEEGMWVGGRWVPPL